MRGTGRRVLEMECPEARGWLHRYVEGELEPVLAGLLDRHLEHCPSCRATRAELEEERLWIIEAALKAPKFSDTFRQKVLDQLQLEKDRSGALRRRNVFFRLSGAAAVLFVLGLASLQTFNGSSAPERTPLLARGGESPNVGVERPRASEPSPIVPRAVEFRGEIEREPIAVLRDPRPGVVEADASFVQADHGHIVRQVGEMISAAVHIGSPGVRVRPVYRDPPCRPDPNRDGKMDLNDVAYSCQILLTGSQPQEALGESETPLLDPDCLDLCLKV